MIDKVYVALEKTEKLLFDSHRAFEHAARALNVQTAPTKDSPIGLFVEDGKQYSKGTLQNYATGIFLVENDVNQQFQQLRGKDNITPQQLDDFVESVKELLLRVQYISTLAAFRDIYKAYEKWALKGKKGIVFRKNNVMFAEILKAMITERPDGISKLSELYDIPGISKEAIENFLTCEGENLYDRRVWLRNALDRAGMYQGKRGRPSKIKT